MLKDKVAIVTGGSRGIGRAIVLKLASQGAHVAFNYHSNEAMAKSLEEECKRMNVRCQGSGVDIRNFELTKEWINSVKENFGRLDILVNNAGIVRDKALMLMTPDDWHEVIATNLDGMFYASKSCIVTFMKQRCGDIVNISSVSGVIGLQRQVNYSASKGAMNSFTKALAKEVAGFGIRVNAVAPGYVATEMLAHLKEEYKLKVIETIPLKRLGRPEDIADAVIFLLSDGAKYITGQIIQVDGGLVMR